MATRTLTSYFRSSNLILMAGGCTLYGIIGYLLLDQIHPELETPGEILTSLLLPLPAFLLMGVWLLIERRAGYPIFPRIKPSPFPASHAQIRTERNAGIALVFLATVMALSPLATSLLSGDVPGFSALAPIMVWLWILRCLGWYNMRHAMVLLFPDRKGPDRSDMHEATIRFVTGIILERRKSPATLWLVQMSFQHNLMVPYPKIRISGAFDGPDSTQVEEIVLDNCDLLALMVAMTGDGNAYRLRNACARNDTVNLTDLSAHERIHHLKDLTDAHARLGDLFPKQGLQNL